MLKTQKIKWKRLLNELEFLYEELDLANDICKEMNIDFEHYYRAYCARNNIDIDKLNRENAERLSELYGTKKPEQGEEIPISEYSGSTALVPVDSAETSNEDIEEPDDLGTYKDLHQDFHKLFRKLAMKLHPDRIENWISDPDYKQTLAWDFSDAKKSYETKEYFRLIQIAKKHNVMIPERYSLQLRWFKKDRDKMVNEINKVKGTYNYSFAECENDEQRNALVEKFLWHLFRFKPQK